MTDLADLLTAFRSRARDGGELTEPFEQIWTVRAACDAIYSLVMGVPLVAVTGDEGETQLGESDALSILLEQPNPFQTGSELAASWAVYLRLDGFAAAVLYAEGSELWDRSMKRLPREILTIDPCRVKIKDCDPLTGMVTSYLVRVTKDIERTIPAHSMLIVRGFNPRNLQDGSSALNPMRSAMSADMQADLYADAMLKNDGTPGTILQLTDDLSKPERDALKAAWDDQYKGPRRKGKTAVVPRGVKVEAPPAQTAKDMNLAAQRDRLIQATKALFGVTDFEMGEIADYNRANADAARAWLWANTILPTLERIEQSLWSGIFRHVGGGSWAKFDVSKVAALAPVLTDKATTAATLINVGFDPESVSEKLGLGIEYLALPEPEPTPPPVAAPPPPPVEPPPPPTAEKAFNIIVRKDAAPRAPLSRVTSMRLMRAWRKHAELVVGKKWRSFTADRYSETIAAARSLADTGPLSAEQVDALLHPVSEWRNGAERAASAAFKGLGKPLAENLDMEVGGFNRIDVGQATFAPAAGRRVAQMVKVGEHLRTRIRSSIVKTIQEGTVADIETILSARFKGLLPSNAAVVARTEAGMFQNDVRQGLMVADGIDEKEWSASMDEWTRQSHRELDGSRVGVTERFANGLLHPCESGGPAGEVIQCRCVALPRIRERE